MTELRDSEIDRVQDDISDIEVCSETSDGPAVESDHDTRSEIDNNDFCIDNECELDQPESSYIEFEDLFDILSSTSAEISQPKPNIREKLTESFELFDDDSDIDPDYSPEDHPPSKRFACLSRRLQDSPPISVQCSQAPIQNRSSQRDQRSPQASSNDPQDNGIEYKPQTAQDNNPGNRIAVRCILGRKIK
ncbi:hypothetical protein J6590_049315 [Homalodisca vitripennis]|nr:hypothetical protein J6590_049315 [Homalodisca vitripennis]